MHVKCLKQLDVWQTYSNTAYGESCLSLNQLKKMVRQPISVCQFACRLDNTQFEGNLELVVFYLGWFCCQHFSG